MVKPKFKIPYRPRMGPKALVTRTWRFKLPSSSLHNTETMAATGTFQLPKWWVPAKLAPPTGFRPMLGKGFSWFSFPEQRYYDTLRQSKMPFLVLEDSPLFKKKRKIAHRFACSWRAKVEAGMTEEEGYQATAIEFDDEIQDFVDFIFTNKGDERNPESIELHRDLKSKVEDHMNLRAEMRRMGKQPRKLSLAEMFEDRFTRGQGLPSEEPPLFALKDVHKRAEEYKQKEIAAASRGEWDAVFPNPFLLRPKTMNASSREIARWINNAKFINPGQAIKNEITYLWNCLRDPTGVFSSAIIEHHASICDFLAFIEDEEGEFKGVPGLPPRIPAESSTAPRDANLAVRDSVKVYTTQEIIDREKRVAELKVVFDPELPVRPAHERFRIPGLHDLITDYDPSKPFAAGVMSPEFADSARIFYDETKFGIDHRSIPDRYPTYDELYVGVKPYRPKRYPVSVPPPVYPPPRPAYPPLIPKQKPATKERIKSDLELSPEEEFLRDYLEKMSGSAPEPAKEASYGRKKYRADK